MKRFFTLLLALPVLVGFFMLNSVAAQDSYQVGDQVEDFTLPSVSGNDISLSSYEDAKGIIVIFTCNHCPYSKLYEDRIIELHNTYSAEGFPVMAINSNDANACKEDSFKNMKKRSKEKGFTFEYCYDESQEIAKTFGATRTPEVYLVTKSETGYTLMYIGAIDDNAKSPDKVETKYLENAIETLKVGVAPDPATTKAVGCTIKWKKA